MPAADHAIVARGAARPVCLSAFHLSSHFMSHEPDHAVNRLRRMRLARSTRPFLARGGSVKRCPGCLLVPDLCACDLRPQLRSAAAFCLVMFDSEPLKPSNTGRLIADVLPDSTHAFLWSRTEPDPALLALLDDPAYQPYLVFPDCEKAPERVVHQVSLPTGKRPLFILLDGTWREARRMANKSPYLDRFAVLAVQPEQLSTYGMRVAAHDEHLCTAEVAACVLESAGYPDEGVALQHWFNLFSCRYLAGKWHRAPDDAALCQALAAYGQPTTYESQE